MRRIVDNQVNFLTLERRLDNAAYRGGITLVNAVVSANHTIESLIGNILLQRWSGIIL